MDNPKLSWNGKDYTCVPYQTDAGKALEAGGLVPSGGQSFVLLLSELGTARPEALKDFVTFDGKTYQVDRVKVSGDSHLVLDCLEPDSGA